jgi:hypothetical protein
MEQLLKGLGKKRRPLILKERKPIESIVYSGHMILKLRKETGK